MVFIKLFQQLFQMSISASYLILAVLLVRFLLRKAPKKMRSFLWLLVGIRLIFPFSVESVFSLIPDTRAVNAYLYELEMEQPGDNTASDTDLKKPVSQPVQNTYVPFTEFTETNKTKSAVKWMFCAKIWAVGLAGMLCYMFYSYLRLKNRIRMSVPTEAVYADGAVKYYQSDAIESPFLFGIVHPRIYIPCGITQDALPYVLCHEQIHRKRKDYLIKPLGFLILSVYWFNPCVWAAYIMLCKDIELICDEYVVREHGTAYKKAYSQALLDSAVNHRMIAACPIAFGEVSVKERVKNVLHYKKPAFWLLVAAVLACIVVPVCFMTQKKTDMVATDEIQKKPDAPAQEDLVASDKTIQIDSIDKIAGEYRMILPESEQEEFLTLDEYNAMYENGGVYIPGLSLGKDGTFSFGYDPFSSYLNFGEYDIVSDCVKAVTYDGKYHYQFTSVGNGMLRFDAEESSELHKANTDIVPDIADGSIFVKISAQSQEQMDELKGHKLTVAAKTIEKWAIAFCDRDAKTILDFADEAVIQQFVEQELLFLDEDGGNESASFGWSSPWPWGAAYNENGRALNYHILSATEHNAEILYYAWVSDPHVTVWRELLTYDMADDACVITSESLQYMDSICVAAEFYQAYPNGITETMMDYYSFNGAGEALNQNAVENRNSDFYKKLFAPDTAAVYLLNILNNPNKVGTRVRESATDENVCIVTFDFYEDGSSVTVQMLRPYGSDGIWVPSTAPDISEQNSEISEMPEMNTAPYVISGENVQERVREDAIQLEALFPDHHEQTSTTTFPQEIDLNGDGVMEQVELINLGYNGGDGGYALRVTDAKTGRQIPLPDGYSEENGFPVFSAYMAPEGEEPQLLIQLGEEKRCQTVAVLKMDALMKIYKQNHMLAELKKVLQNKDQDQKPNERILADAVSGCNIVTYSGEETPVLLLKTYVSGFLGHVDTLGYVITELRLEKDNTWSARHFFLLDSCDAQAMAQQEAEKAENKAGGNLVYPHKMGINMIPLTPDEP